jgi:sulfocyanin
VHAGGDGSTSRLRRFFSSMDKDTMPRLAGSFPLIILLAGGFPGSILQAQDSTPTAPIDTTWLSYDAPTKTVHFQLIAGLTGLNGALNFNGFRDGGLILVVPAGSKVVVDFINHDGMLPHSAEVIPATLPVPSGGDDPAIQRAYTDKLVEGLPPQAKDGMTFTANPPGDYFIFCGVPGHGQGGMYIGLKVSATAKAPSLMPAPKKSAAK